VKGRTVKRGKRRFADFLMSIEPNMALALIEAKDNSIASGGQRGLGYVRTPDGPFGVSTNESWFSRD